MNANHWIWHSCDNNPMKWWPLHGSEYRMRQWLCIGAIWYGEALTTSACKGQRLHGVRQFEASWIYSITLHWQARSLPAIMVRDLNRGVSRTTCSVDNQKYKELWRSHILIKSTLQCTLPPKAKLAANQAACTSNLRISQFKFAHLLQPSLASDHGSLSYHAPIHRSNN